MTNYRGKPTKSKESRVLTGEKHLWYSELKIRTKNKKQGQQ
jgi:hypothetical protein